MRRKEGERAALDNEVEAIGARGWVEVIVKDKDGNIKQRFPPQESDEEAEDDPPIVATFPAKMAEYYWRRNIVVNTGLAAIIRLIFSGLTEDKFGYLAIGTGTSTESPNDTALGNEIARKLASITQITSAVEGDTAKLEAEFSSSDGISGTHSVSESGIFNSSSGGILLARKVFPAMTLDFTGGDSIMIRYYVQILRA